MWQPEPGWQRLSGGGPSTLGLWRARENGREVVLKRLQAPTAHDPGEFSLPHHAAWWRRAADVALSGFVERTAGVRSGPALRVEEDVEGITLVTDWVEQVHHSGLFLARSLATLASEPLPDAPWLAVDQLRGRLTSVAYRGGWSTLARTQVADVADHFWRRRESFLAQLDALPQVPSHGDPTPSNLWGRDGDAVMALDWSGFGRSPVGTDLAHLALASREEFEPLLEAYACALATGVASPAQVLLGARITAVYTALTRADWALARVAGGEGALAGKFRHPSVAPSLRTLQRQFPHVEALLA